MRYCEKSGDRTGSARSGADDGTRGLSERRALAVVRMSAAPWRISRARTRTPVSASASSRWPIGIGATARG